MPAAVKRLLLILLVFSPAMFTAHLMWEKAVDVGCWDMWENAPLLQNWNNFREGKMSWSEFGGHLYSAQIQHRIVVPRLIIIGLTHLSGGDFRWEQYFTFLIFLLNSCLLWVLVKRTLGDSAWRWPLMFAINLLIFSPMHYQILFWGSCFWTAIPVACLLGIVILLCVPRDEKFWWRVALSILLAEIATHSFAHGLALWPLLLTLILLFDSAPLKKRIAAAAVALAVAGITIASYFHNFINVAHHAYDLKPGDHALKGASSLFESDHLMQAVQFFFAFIGTWFARSPFVDHPLNTARILGIATLVMFIAALLVFILRRQPRYQWRAALPWLALAAFVIGVGLMISKRGADIGEHRAVTPRYLAVSQYLLVSMLALPLILGRRRLKDSNQPETLPSGMVPAALFSAFIMAQIPVWQYGLHLTQVWHHARRQAQALVLFLPHIKIDNQKVLAKNSKSWRCINAVNTLNSLNLLKFKPLKSPELKWFSVQNRPLGPEKASIEMTNYREDGALELSGHARFGVNMPADAVLITQGDKVIALGQPSPRNVLRIYGLDCEFSNFDEVPVSAMYPWKATIHADSIADGTSASLDFWALDVKKMQITKLSYTLSLDPSSKNVKMEHIK